MSKKKGTNWFVEQEKANSPQKKNAPPDSGKSKSKTTSKSVTVKAPILAVLEKSKKEDLHFEQAFAFANRTSNAKSDVIQTVHYTMQDSLVFNMDKDNTYNDLWTSQKLALLMCFPCNWKTISLKDLIEVLSLDVSLEMLTGSRDSDDEDDDGDDNDDFDMEFAEWNELDPEERFDLLYETGLKIYEKSR